MKEFIKKILKKALDIFDLVSEWFLIYLPVFILAWVGTDLFKHRGEEFKGLVYSSDNMVLIFGTVFLLLLTGFISALLIMGKIIDDK